MKRIIATIAAVMAVAFSAAPAFASSTAYTFTYIGNGQFYSWEITDTGVLGQAVFMGLDPAEFVPINCITYDGTQFCEWQDVQTGWVLKEDPNVAGRPIVEEPPSNAGGTLQGEEEFSNPGSAGGDITVLHDGGVLEPVVASPYSEVYSAPSGDYPWMILSA